ncbi:hypothetical protein [Deinococcus radiotolerans]|uniref:Lipoprotein n=1 Tax=Deinococcus radiotolerans TaxID=1309407 RepID=A0ABQ2FM36_9DEIO|nr:hypothetical protein [Deinococcus radiotolerans]GGL07985.1 hypothetical protein GCM10010844_28400 [Deinococcus radiotolerans]
MRALLSVLLALTVSSCSVIDLRGADFVGREDARRYIAACARSRTDLYCKALLPTLERTPGQVTVLMVNLGDDDRTAAIERELRRQGLTLDGFVGSAAADRFARANIFLAPRIQAGTMTSLDGRSHTVTCGLNDLKAEECVIDGTVRGGNTNEPGPGVVGNVFVTDAAILPFN